MPAVWGFLLTFIVSHAETALPTVDLSPWHCVGQQIELVGDSDHYRLTGKDSWRGKGNLFCNKELRQEVRTVQISYNSGGVGRGVDADSKLRLDVDILTVGKPETLDTLTILKVVVNESGIDYVVTWRVKQDWLTAVFQVGFVDPKYGPSMSWGTLELQ